MGAKKRGRTPHQQRVMAALLALENAHGWPWWSRDAIGDVVGAGGYHATIQRSTMGILKRAGLVQTERSSWTPQMQAQVRCWCACHRWGLTEAGRSEATALRLRWTDDAQRRLERCSYEVSSSWWDEDEDPPGWDRDDDDDDGRDPSFSPRPLEPALA